MHYRRYNKNEKAKFIRIINELNLKLCEMKNSVRHDELCKVETQERNNKEKCHKDNDNENKVNVFASYQSCIIERIQVIFFVISHINKTYYFNTNAYYV